MREFIVYYLESKNGIYLFERIKAKCIESAKRKSFKRLLEIYGNHHHFEISHILEHFHGVKHFCCA